MFERKLGGGWGRIVLFARANRREAVKVFVAGPFM
jgi:hypothetical protein